MAFGQETSQNAFIPSLSYIDLNAETFLFLYLEAVMMKKNFDFLEVRLCGQLFVNFYSIAVKDTSCAIRLLTKFELPARASNKTRLIKFHRVKTCVNNDRELVSKYSYNTLQAQAFE